MAIFGKAGSRVLVCATILVIAAQGEATADGGPPATERDVRILSASPWTVSAMPYLWLPWLPGDVTVKGVTGNLYINPFQVLDHLERMPWMSYIEARNGRFALYNDIFYAKLGVNVSNARTFGSATVETTLGADFSEGVIEAGAAYQIAKW